MALRFLILFGIFGYITAGDYNNNQPSNNLPSIEKVPNENVAIKSYSIDNNPRNALSTSKGYNYPPPPTEQPSYADYDTPAKYEFTYGVHDELTGDIKSHTESREGDLVRGSYSLIDSDGYKRTVVYTADKANGFNAIVSREPIAVKTVVQVQPLGESFEDLQQYQEPHQQLKQLYEEPQQQQKQVVRQYYPKYVEPRGNHIIPPVQTVESPYP